MGTLLSLRDNADILLADNEDTYTLIERMIRSASEPVASKRIHIGIDEAHGIGLGRYREINGCKDQFEIMNRHLRRVAGITRKLRLEPMMWSDMYLRLGSKTGDY